MTRNPPARVGWKMFKLSAIFLGLMSCASVGLATDFGFGGRSTARFVGATYPDDSLFRTILGSNSKDGNVDTRFIFDVRGDRWDFKADYQAIAIWGDSLELGRALPPGLGTISAGRLLNDDRRLFDLTEVLIEQDDFVLIQRLDRLSVGYTTDKAALRFGRQAITWGNGLIYAPMDIFNPFDPAAVDREFKTGDDMLYGQFLRSNGDDLQAVMVFRRDLVTGDVEADQSALALKYHGMAGPGEYDLLAAENYGDTLVAIGGNLSVGGGVARSDLVVTFTDDDPVASFVASYSESWTWGGKNLTGVIEYFFNGFGQRDGQYSPADLQSNPDLVDRLLRGELFTLGRHYVAGSATIEVTPLFLLTPNLFFNLEDPSALVQIVTQNDLRENLVLLGALGIPIGPDGSEFGGSDAGIPGLYLSTGASLFVQLSWYF